MLICGLLAACGLHLTTASTQCLRLLWALFSFTVLCCWQSDKHTEAKIQPPWQR